MLNLSSLESWIPLLVPGLLLFARVAGMCATSPGAFGSLHVIREKDGRLNLDGIIGVVDLKERVPTIVIQQGTIVVEDRTLSVAAPYTPAAGTLGALGGTVAIAPASFSAGAATVANLTYSEAGSVTLQATSVNFLGSAGVNYTAASGVVGRFFADHFALLAGVSVTPACGSFTYMDQTLAARQPVLRWRPTK